MPTYWEFTKQTRASLSKAMDYVPTASISTRSAEYPLTASRMAPKAEMMHPIIKSLGFIPFLSSNP